MATAVSVDLVEEEHPRMIQTGKGTTIGRMASLYKTGVTMTEDTSDKAIEYLALMSTRC